MQRTRWVTVEVGRSLDTAIDVLRWCKAHKDDRLVTTRLQQLQMAIGAAALALDYEMDGQQDKSMAALEQADWSEIHPRDNISGWRGH